MCQLSLRLKQNVKQLIAVQEKGTKHSKGAKIFALKIVTILRGVLLTLIRPLLYHNFNPA